MARSHEQTWFFERKQPELDLQSGRAFCRKQPWQGTEDWELIRGKDDGGMFQTFWLARVCVCSMETRPR